MAFGWTPWQVSKLTPAQICAYQTFLSEQNNPDGKRSKRKRGDQTQSFVDAYKRRVSETGLTSFLLEDIVGRMSRATDV